MAVQAIDFMKLIAFIVLVFGIAVTAFARQGSAPPPPENAARLLGLSNAHQMCNADAEMGKTICETTLANSINTKRNKVGDHVTLKTLLLTAATDEPVTSLEGTIVEIRVREKGQPNSLLRIRIEKATRRNRSEFPLEAKIVALASLSRVKEELAFPGIIVDRFPRVPEDNERQPGERKYSEEERRTSPLDSIADVPVQYKTVCHGKRDKASQQKPCSDLLAARGVYGYKKLTIDPARTNFAAETVLTATKDRFAFPAGTVFVLEMKTVSTSKDHH